MALLHLCLAGFLQLAKALDQLAHVGVMLCCILLCVRRVLLQLLLQLSSKLVLGINCLQAQCSQISGPWRM